MVRVPKLKLGDLVEVDWIDATSDPSWFERKDFKWPVMHVTSIGYYFDQNEVAICLVNSLFDDYEEDKGTVGGYQTIPKGMILEVRRMA